MDDQKNKKKLSGDNTPVTDAAVTDAAVGQAKSDDSDEEMIEKMKEFSKTHIIDIYPDFFTKVRANVDPMSIFSIVDSWEVDDDK